MAHVFICPWVVCLAASLGLAIQFHASSSLAREATPLQRVGALHCSAWQAHAAEPTTKLRCTLRLPDADVEHSTYEGEMRGKGLHVVAPGSIRVLWNVLSPTTRLDPVAVAGSYSATSEGQLRFPEGTANVLVGGLGDSIALELVAPRVDPIDPSTELVLRQAD